MRKAEPIAAAFRISLTPTVLVRVNDGAIVSANPAAERLLGYSLAQLSERTPSELGLWPSAMEQARVWAQVGEDGSARAVDLNLRTAEGSELLLSMDCEALHWRGEALLLCFLQPRTASASGQRAFPTSLHEALIDACRDGMFLVHGGFVRFANQALADMLQLSREQVIGQSYFDFVHPEDQVEQKRRRDEREDGYSDEQRYRVRLRRADGEYRHFEIVASALPMENGLASMGVARDVTESLLQQKALESAERRYRDLFESSPIGLFKTHSDGRILDANQVLLDLIGFADIDQLRAAGWTMRDVYVDNAKRDEVLEQVFNHGTIRDAELEIRTRNAERLWVSCCVRKIDGEGAEATFAGSVQDISRRRTAEIAFHQADARYRALVDHVQVGVFLLRDGRFVQVNASLAALLGVSENDLVGQAVADWASPDSRQDMERRYWLSGAAKSLSQDFEAELQRRDGRRIWVIERLAVVDIEGDRYFSGTWRDVTREREVERRLRFNATHDSLTGLPNRLDFQQRLNDTILESRTAGCYDYAVLFLDLDGFKLINDSQGHAAGDRLLVSLASRLTDAIAGEALIARYGGDEFTVLPFGPCDRDRAAGLAQRLLRVFDQPMSAGEEQVFSSASVGIVLGIPSYRDAADVLRDADTAMYRAKASGKATWRVFDDQMRNQAKWRYEMEREIRRALEQEEFEPYYQPIVDLPAGRPVGCEALVRWHHPNRGLLLPGEFLPVAEESGLIHRIDARVMEQSCAEAKHWQAAGWSAGALSVSVNVADRQASSPQFASEVRSVLQRHQLTAETLRLEISESAFREGRQRASDLLGALKQVGVGLAVDDFGTGYSSLESFSSAPFDTLKIDRSLVQDLTCNDKHRAIVRTILGFGRDLGLTVIAEGVETDQQREALEALGCRFAQGFLFGHAMPSAEWLDYLRRFQADQ
ncbi:EAL domain-containing protein [Pseudomarimonas arenosa]|uniref:EAL domain-containing protein n=1 Tax=Pseudomarimonas arenosa TaxID=2774145 RepID=A0AAW3ZEH6_9GAMM|nr:EAL domain-containing protein [Pseudomarimonas arenosa]MBD8524578.1 EAL domain-containing protein [Pseudomarimonas arenosa]